MFVAVIAMFILPDFPANTRWLSDTERRLAFRRLEEDTGIGDQRETEAGGPLYGLLLAIKDWRVWWLALAMISQSCALSFNAYFPTLAATMGKVCLDSWLE